MNVVPDVSFLSFQKEPSRAFSSTHATISPRSHQPSPAHARPDLRSLQQPLNSPHAPHASPIYRPRHPHPCRSPPPPATLTLYIASGLVLRWRSALPCIGSPSPSASVWACRTAPTTPTAAGTARARRPAMTRDVPTPGCWGSRGTTGSVSPPSRMRGSARMPSDGGGGRAGVDVALPMCAGRAGWSALKKGGMEMVEGTREGLWVAVSGAGEGLGHLKGAVCGEAGVRRHGYGGIRSGVGVVEGDGRDVGSARGADDNR
ncbi:hypothetical protein B0J12DRAFT_687017 [Macrophomina phaseolina]|uniref:Uncharacterized protein n=1 Tax=Macrophomina phaseolina TaxID=35725 RepID=A0ABQ8FSQ9_9PEZI|nr:hypothetical protein B0J12DRAFT_687017 [Macrophomina phaseolina]